MIIRMGHSRPKRKGKMVPSLCRNGVGLGDKAPLSSGLQSIGHTQASQAGETAMQLKMLLQGSQGAGATAWSLSGEGHGNHGWKDSRAAPACERAKEPHSKIPSEGFGEDGHLYVIHCYIYRPKMAGCTV